MDRYNIFQNVLYVYKKADHFDRRFKFKLMLSIFLTLILPVIAALIPAATVYLITSGTRAVSFVMYIGGIILVYASLQALEFYVTNNLNYENIFIRVKEGLYEVSMKSMTTDYRSIESNKGKLMMSKAVYSLLTNWEGLELMLKSFPKFVSSLAGIVAYSAFIGSINIWILVLLIGMTLACTVLNAYASSYELRHREDKTQTHLRLEYFVDESRKLENSKDIRIYGLEDWFVKTIRLLTRKYSTLVLKEQTCYYVPQLSNSIFTIARDLLSYTILINQVATGLIDATAFVFLTGIIASFSSWLNQLTDSISSLRKASIGVNSMRAYMGIPSAADREYGDTSIDISAAGPSIEFRDVSLTYPEASTPSVSHFNLKINAGEKIALVGLNGAGKTTIVKLLSGLYVPSEGDILIDGVSIKKLNPVEYQKRISAVFQDVRPLAFTIAENVACCPENDIDYGKVMNCLERAGLGEKVWQLPLKEKTCISQVLDSEGIQLSGGQLQKLMLARALYKNAPILILDEPTAALDPLAEEQMYMKYNETTKGKTSIFISHRLSSTQFCDRIVFMKSGKIVEIGNHTQLMEAKGSYAEMFYIQSQYYKDNEKEESSNEQQIC